MFKVDFIKTLEPALLAECEDQDIRISAICSMQYNERTFSYIFSVRRTIKNLGNRDLSCVKSLISFYDEEGNKLDESWSEYYGFDKALLPGSSVETEEGFQIKLDKRPSQIKIGIMEIKDTTEMPLCHLPLIGEYLYEALDDEHLKQMKDNKPVSVTAGVAMMGTIVSAASDDPQMIEQVITAFNKVRIRGSSQIWVTDNDNYVIFTFADGTKSGARFNQDKLELMIRHKNFLYELEDLQDLFILMHKIARRQNEI